MFNFLVYESLIIILKDEKLEMYTKVFLVKCSGVEYSKEDKFVHQIDSKLKNLN